MKYINSNTHRPAQPFFRAALQADGTLEILIYEEIGQNPWSDDGGLTAKTVKQQLDLAGKYSKILVRINSPGGDAFEGIAVYTLLRAQKKPVEVYVDGIAASSASIIAMAGDTITMGPASMMMIHNAWAFCMGDAADMTKMAEALNKISESIAQAYVVRTGKTLDEIKALMDGETWMTAEECVAGGFAMEITSELGDEIEQNALAMARKFKALSRLKHVPANLKDANECECSCENCVAGDCSNCTNAECDDPNCIDCPMQAAGESSNLSLYLIRARKLGLAG
jgi:ATP-dependent protease ClpP protease subunit